MVKTMDAAYKLSNVDHLNPAQVYEKIKTHDPTY